jgi:hypothetical protein
MPLSLRHHDVPASLAAFPEAPGIVERALRLLVRLALQEGNMPHMLHLVPAVLPTLTLFHNGSGAKSQCIALLAQLSMHADNASYILCALPQVLAAISPPSQEFQLLRGDFSNALLIVRNIAHVVHEVRACD